MPEIDVNRAANEPKKASGDGISVEKHSIADLIAAEKYANAKAQARGKQSGLRFAKLRPPGTIGEQ